MEAEEKNMLHTCAEIATKAYVFLLFSVYPLYVRNGYTDIMTAKSEFYTVITGGYLGILILFGIVGCMVRRNEIPRILRRMKFTMTDFWVVVFAVSALVSWIWNGNTKTMLLGTYGRNVGLLTILSCVITYMCISRLLKFERYLLLGMMICGMLVMGLAVVNHTGYDPFGMYVNYTRQTVFMSTLGNINVLSSYISILLPFGMGLYVTCRERQSQIVYGVFTWLGFLGMYAANSDSAVLVVIVSFVVLLFWSREGMYGERLLHLVLGFSVAGGVLELLRWLRGSRQCVKLMGLNRILLDIRMTLGIWIIALGLLIWLRSKKNGEQRTDIIWKKIRRIFFVGFWLTVVFFAGIIMYVNLALDQDAAKEQLGYWYPYLYFGKAWGTSRLAVWDAVITTYMRMPFANKLVGCGPAGFYEAARVYLTGEELAEFTWGSLTDAHNEYLQYFVTTGVAGVTAYCGICVTSIRQFWESGRKEHSMLAFVMVGIAYMIQAVTNNPHIYIEPLIFVLFALGRSMTRRE